MFYRNFLFKMEEEGKRRGIVFGDYIGAQVCTPHEIGRMMAKCTLDKIDFLYIVMPCKDDALKGILKHCN